MRAKIIKIVGWTLGMAVGVFLITDSKAQSKHPLEDVLIGAAIGLTPGILFARNLKTKKTDAAN